MSEWCVCDYDDDPPALGRVTTPRARKAYACEECGGPIGPGDRYEHTVWLCEGKWNTFRCCTPCLEGPVAFVERNCGCVPWGNLREHLTDVFREYPFTVPGAKFRVGRLVVGMRRRRQVAAPAEAAR